ncbi:general transcription factor IIH subunit TFB6 family [Aspergillus homomorphus CBS 101889]|uniref:Meiotic recombination protein DMC1 n=1 Tax=Aspergillus homomorphus (strain CBS 101889) TaxID=1450537 RepID=A0A395HLC1_ASPHC|nr:hypothetical protein BO97DRAFT_408188 [Aspergillus homomorphus CBS 101889]RAL08657.1 hypothetical protein BO97DRAFT_408188 [Aspergillus homomorphus CBS 101889]
MTTATTSRGEMGGGGFIPPAAHPPSPAPTASTATPSLLPKPRAHPLRPGSAKEATVLEYIDKKLLSISRRHAKKFSRAFIGDDNSSSDNSSSSHQRSAPAEPERGYESFKEIARDFESLVDVLWVSGTPSLQIPYLISLAVQVNSYLPDYPFAAKATFRLLRKLDSVFASLLLGEDADSGEPLPGFEGRGNVVSMTEKVRIKSIAETCRVVVVEAREKEDLGDDDDDDGDDGRRNGVEDSSENDDFDDDEMMNDDVFGMDEYPIPGRWEMETAKVYEKTIQLLGDELGKADTGEFCDTDMAAGEEGGLCDGLDEEAD